MSAPAADPPQDPPQPPSTSAKPESSTSGEADSSGSTTEEGGIDGGDVQMEERPKEDTLEDIPETVRNVSIVHHILSWCRQAKGRMILAMRWLKGFCWNLTNTSFWD